MGEDFYGVKDSVSEEKKYLQGAKKEEMFSK